MTDPRRDADPPRRRPLGIDLLIWLYWFWAGALVLLSLGIALGEGPVTLGGRAVPRGQALRTLLPTLAPMFMAVVGAALTLAMARPLGRPAALFPFLLIGFGPALTTTGSSTPAELARSLLLMLPVLLFLGWYLYGREATRAYFRRGRDPGGPAGSREGEG